MLCCAGGPQLEAGSPLGASGASDGTVALWDARAREACVWRAAAHQDACTGVDIVDGGWVVSCARDGSVAASHIGGGRQRLLRAAGGGPAQRCLQVSFLSCLLASNLLGLGLGSGLGLGLGLGLAFFLACLLRTPWLLRAHSPLAFCRPSAAPRTSGTCVPCSSAARCR